VAASPAFELPMRRTVLGAACSVGRHVVIVAES
jgi:hypothetical protein